MPIDVLYYSQTDPMAEFYYPMRPGINPSTHLPAHELEIVIHQASD